ncbi:MAG: imidazole glycerol phosphate synthase subunit HisH [Verrucomicrobiae bacterium]|nr:imidazole glycerol phosphate synthase subunit HisH [Verrucomicrobiae bacterium]
MKKCQIGLVDYGMGNVRSVEKALEHVGAEVFRAMDAKMLSQADKLVMPGQGAFRDCVAHLQKNELWEALIAWLKKGSPFLGICLGQQALFETAYENGKYQGFGFFQGTVERFQEKGLKIPQIGWNNVHFTRSNCPLFCDIPDKSYFYFDHSYIVKPAQPDIVAGETEYGETFSSIVWRENCYAVQFHPEKSQEVGLKLLENFVKV